MLKTVKIILIAATIVMALAGQAMAQGGDSAGNTGAAGTSKDTSGGGAKAAESKSTITPAAGAKSALPSKTASPVEAPVTGSMGRVYTGGWSGLGGGFIGDFGPQYNTYPCGFGMESWNLFGPLGMFGQYGMYGPTGMYGPAGPSFGSGLGFGGISPDDPWRIYKGYNIARAAPAAKPPATATGQKAGAGSRGGSNATTQGIAA
ncbi:hypothetical protein [Methanocella sp. MCL-LM]|uniref:hypothetical protein n=1 Tax=Methanocella sp. MCL-LM TaxID=3412035 RepID=UPI003C775C96